MIRDAVARNLFGERAQHSPHGKDYVNVTVVNFYPQKGRAEIYYGTSSPKKKAIFLNLSEVQFGSPVNIFWTKGPKKQDLIDANYVGCEADAWIEKDTDTGHRILMISN